MSIPHNNNIAYGLSQPLIDVFPIPITSPRSPTGNDKNFQYGQVWINQTNNFIYMLASITQNVANWILVAQGAGNIDTLTTADGHVVPPTAGNINLLGEAGLITTVGTIATSTINVNLVNGANGQVMIGGGAAPVWANIIGTTGIGIVNGANSITIEGNGEQFFNVTDVGATPYNVAATDQFISVDTSVLAITINLPLAPGSGKTWIIKDGANNAAANNITVSGNGRNIDNAANFIINNNEEAVSIVFNNNLNIFQVY